VTARLCIFTRVPLLGAVKSRLAATIGVEGALAAHCALVEDTLDRLAVVTGMESVLWLDGAPDARVLGWQARWLLPLRRQCGAELGARMYHALSDCLGAGLDGIVVGTDCPEIDAAYVARAAAALALHDLVLGPAADGGFGLVGISRPAPGLFDDVVWGGDQALAGTLANAARLRLRTCLLPQIWDVDDAADWERWQRNSDRG
jgi:hypothetical protein